MIHCSGQPFQENGLFYCSFVSVPIHHIQMKQRNVSALVQGFRECALTASGTADYDDFLHSYLSTEE